MTGPFPNPAPWDGDPAQVAEEARVLLRLAADDPDVAGRLVPLSWAISDLVRDFLGFEFDDGATEIDESVHQACIAALMDTYRRKDTSFGITGAWSNDGVAIKVSNNWLDGVLAVLQSKRRAFGVA